MNDETRKKRRVPVLVLAAALVLAAMSATASAAAREEIMIVPVGRAVGIKLFSDGVIVVGMSDIATQQGMANPARDCGLKEGDIITHINREEVDTIEEVKAVLQQLEGETMSIRALRGDQQLQVTTQAVQCSADGSYKLGAWIRDSMAGIGTMTYYLPSTGTFGALGHGVNDTDTALLMPMEEGGIIYAQVAEVQKGEAGAPGQLKGEFKTSKELGTLSANTDRGVFGTLEDKSLIKGCQAIPMGWADQVTEGPATILSNVRGDKVEEYTIEIVKIFAENGKDNRDMMIRVTDPALLERTGGVVQGMSGSPILQNGRIVGAVTHVLVNDPTRGYGIFIENMLEAAGGGNG